VDEPMVPVLQPVQDELEPPISVTALLPLKEECVLSTLPQAPLMPFDATARFEHGIPFAFPDYLELVDTVGRAIRPDKYGAIPLETPKILARLAIDTETFIAHASRLLKEFGHAVGTPENLIALASKCKSTWKTFQGSGVFNIEYFPPRNCVNIWRFAGVTWGDRYGIHCRDQTAPFCKR
ncbi:MAG: hypothetical protein WCP34_13980, partial [Pseudomonadota bacterium]